MPIKDAPLCPWGEAMQRDEEVAEVKKNDNKEQLSDASPIRKILERILKRLKD